MHVEPRVVPGQAQLPDNNVRQLTLSLMIGTVHRLLSLGSESTRVRSVDVADYTNLRHLAKVSASDQIDAIEYMYIEDS